MMSEINADPGEHKRDHHRLQHAQEIPVCATQIRPEKYTFGPGSESTWKSDQKTEERPNGRWDGIEGRALLERKKPNHPVSPAETILSNETPKQTSRQATLHMTAAHGNTLTMSSVREPSNQISIFLAVATYHHANKNPVPSTSLAVFRLCVIRDDKRRSVKKNQCGSRDTSGQEAGSPHF